MPTPTQPPQARQLRRIQSWDSHPWHTYAPKKTSSHLSLCYVADPHFLLQRCGVPSKEANDLDIATPTGMAHSVFWPKKRFFYPVGNTPPVCFTQDSPPEESVDVLLLGCGDPRSILYTVYADLGVDRKLDFTCCDIEPAILARNVLLLTLAVDNANIDQVWNIFFHFYIDKESLELLQTQCRKLIDLSIDVEKWRNSKYGSFLHYSTTHTLSELRRHWILYKEAHHSSSQKEKSSLRASFADGMKAVQVKFKHTNVQTAFRSAGPLFLDISELGSTHFRRFWATGVTFQDPGQVALAIIPNPTFAFSVMGRGFDVHYGTDPILPFYLADTLAAKKSTIQTASIQDLVESARSQFRTWCSAFRECVTESPNIVIRLFTGDALAFSRALHHYSETSSGTSGLYTHPWSGIQIKLDEEEYEKRRAPVSFSVIDTSNLTDHLGLVNILITTVPLLSNIPSAVLHTNTLLSSAAEGNFVDRTCTDIPTLSLLLGVVPISYVSGFTTRSNIHEIFKLGLNSPQFHEAIAWKALPPTESAAHETSANPKFSPTQLGSFLFSIYLRMFSDEDMSGFLHRDTQTMHRPGVLHYIRSSFAVLLRLIKHRVSTNWLQAIDHLVSLIEADKTLLTGSNHYQDLCCQMHVQGVYTVGSLDVMLPRQYIGGVFQNWRHVPPVVCVVLQVPRSKLTVLESTNLDVIGTPPLQCEIRGSFYHNAFSSIQCIFGKLAESRHGQTLSIEEDHLHWAGSSPLIVSFYMPSWILALDPSKTTLSLNIRSIIGNSPLLIQKLGLTLALFTVRLTDKKHVTITRERPSNPGELKSSAKVSPTTNYRPCNDKERDTYDVSVIMNAAHTETSMFTARINIASPGARTALTSGANVTVQQASPISMVVSFKNFRYNLAFPFPIDNHSSKIRIARKSFYIEVDVALSRPSPESPHSLRLQPFPVVFRAPQPTLWNIHYLNLDSMPLLKASAPTGLDWLKGHINLTMSVRERADETTHLRPNPFLHIKHTIANILFRSSDQEQRCRIFGMKQRGAASLQIVIFVHALRLDLPSHTVVADSYVLPLASNALAAQQTLQEITTLEAHAYREISNEQLQDWKQLIPALVERCRTWKHLETCQYLQKGTILDESLLCGCGEGSVSPSFMDSEWGKISPFVTRLALSPLFAVSYLEDIGNNFSTPPTTVSRLGEQSPACQRCGNAKQELKLCSRCKRARYCSKACQNEDWKAHKVQCKV